MPADAATDPKFEIGHVLFIDIVGYSKLLIGEQSELVRQLKEVIAASNQVRLAEGRGKLISLPAGDGVALVFRDGAEAPAQCALEVARAVDNYPHLQLRMGIHSGPVNVVTDVNNRPNIAGAGINIAQRVMDCGDARHILLSKHAAEDLEAYGRWRPYLHDLGECEVKHGARISLVNLCGNNFGNADIPERLKRAKRQQKRISRRRRKLIFLSMSILAVAALGMGYWIFRQNRATDLAAIPLKSIAVLPFENRSEDKANAYFADGIQDEILTRLSKVADLKVISRTSTQHYKSAPENLPEIGRQLGVAYILEGSVQKSGDAVRVNVQLIRAANDSHLWADSFDRKLTDIFSVESEVAKAIADQLRVHLTGQERQVIAAKPTDNPQAYDAYLRGLAYSLKGADTSANSLGAQKYLREAVRLDPKFALSWALLSYVDAIGYITQSLQFSDTLREEAREAAEIALTLQPNLGEAVMAKGFYYYAFAKDYAAAVRYFEQARSFLPSSSQIPESLAYVTRRRGQWEQSESYFNEAERLDPRNVVLLNQHARSYIMLRRFPEALRKFDQILNIIPDDLDALTRKAAIAQAEGDLSRASGILALLHPTTDDISALEIQIYQAILERRPAQIIRRLNEILSKPDPALGYNSGELRFYLGWAQKVAGDQAAARATWRQALEELEPFLKAQPENYLVLGDLALTNMGLGDKAPALSFAERGIAVNPVEKDVPVGPASLDFLARVAAQLDEPDRAIATLEKLLSVPYDSATAAGTPLTPALLRLDPMFDPLRTDPRFQKLCEEKHP